VPKKKSSPVREARTAGNRRGDCSYRQETGASWALPDLPSLLPPRREDQSNTDKDTLPPRTQKDIGTRLRELGSPPSDLWTEGTLQ